MFFGLFEKSESIEILSDTNINDKILEIIFDKCPEIEVLDISSCNQISNEVIARIPSRLRRLSGLKLSY